MNGLDSGFNNAKVLYYGSNKHLKIKKFDIRDDELVLVYGINSVDDVARLSYFDNENRFYFFDGTLFVPRNQEYIELALKYVEMWNDFINNMVGEYDFNDNTFDVAVDFSYGSKTNYIQIGMEISTYDDELPWVKNYMQMYFFIENGEYRFQFEDSIKLISVDTIEGVKCIYIPKIMELSKSKNISCFSFDKDIKKLALDIKF